MKLLALSVIAFIIGFALGGWPPRSDLLVREGEIEELKAQLADKAYKGNPSLSGITQMLNVPEKAAPPKPEMPASDEGTPEEAEPAAAELAAEPEPETPEEPRDFRAHIEEAAELWLLRADLARQGFLDTIAASPDQALRFDVVIEALNLRLETTIAQWADVLAKDTMPPTEAGIRMMKDITEALAIAYDDLDQGMPVSWKRDAGDTFQIVDYIDPVVALPLADVEDKLDF